MLSDLTDNQKTDNDRVMEALAEIRTHLLAMLGAIDGLLWFMKEDRPHPFDQEIES